MVARRGQEAGDHQLPHAASREGRPVLREDLRTDPRLGVLLRQVQAGALQGHHLRALRRRGDAFQGPSRPHGPHRAVGARRPHLVPARHAVVAGLPAGRHRAQGRAQGQAAREGHLLRRQPGHLGRRGQAPRGSDQPRGRVPGRARRDPQGARARRRPPLQGARVGGRGGRVRGHRHQEAPSRRRQGDRVAARALQHGARADRAGVGRVQEPALAQDHRGRDAVARAARQVRRLLRGWHRRRRDQAADRPDRLRRGGDQAPRGDRARPRVDPQGALGAASPEGDQAPQDRRLVQPSRRARPPDQRPQGDDPRRRAGDPARTAPDGAARRWPLRHVRPQRPLPPRDQPQQPV